MNKSNLVNRKPGIIGEEDYKKYSVLVPFIEKPDGMYLLFEKRAMSLVQPGEICFPGGKREAGETNEQCAVRETMEELCVKSDQIEVIAPADIFISPFNLIIYPFIGEIKDYEHTFSTDEVAEIVLIPLQYLQGKQPDKYISRVINQPDESFPYDRIHGGKNYSWAKGQYDIYFYYYEDHVIWGMTARILKSVLELLQ